jgi:hypothetical protein
MPRPREPHLTPRTADERTLHDYLEQDRTLHVRCGHDLTTRGYAYVSISDFLLRHGQWYAPRPLPRGIPRGAPRQCFGNALLAALRLEGDLFYVEGWSIGYVVPVPHAWCTDAHGRLYELTWETPGTAYLGVEFSLERASNCCWEGDATVLDDYRRHWPLLGQPWTGEPAVSLAPPSPWLALMRAGKLEEARQWLLQHRHDGEETR